jgi:serine/threonine protein kinase
MVTCPKCRKQNPPDAVFCGFCGAKVAPQQPAPAASKTVFGYNLDATGLPGAQKEQKETSAPDVAPAPKPGPPAVSPREESRRVTVPMPQKGGRPSAGLGVQPTVPVAEGGTPLAASGLLGGKYQLGPIVQRLPGGQLCRAADTKEEGAVEVFLVDAAVFPSPLDMERARRELRQLQKVDCPQLVRIIDHGKTDDGRLFIVLEEARGRSLAQRIAQGPVGLAETQQVVREIGTGLAEAQKVGVIHRDIAPHNVVLCDSGQVKIRGFGVAAPIHRNVFGTAEYISPEQAAGRPVDQRSNIYSLGALMFSMLTGEPPFSAKSSEELLEKHQKEEPVAPNARRPGLGLSPRAEALVLKALAKSSSRRHLTLRQFLREVEALSSAAETPEVATNPPISFVTPLHGMTALTGGKRPPSTEVSPLVAGKASPPLDTRRLSGSGPVELAATTIPDGLPLGATLAAAPPPSQGPVGSVSPMAKTLPPQSGVPLPEAKEPASTPADPGRRTQITGEMSSGVALRHAPPAPAPPSASPGPPQPAPPPAAGGPEKKPAFRETMWFFKGEVESAMAESGGETPDPAPAVEATPQELTAKYADDGSLTDEEARRLSLRTGKTQMMAQVRVPRGTLPGEKMNAEEFLKELDKRKRLAIWVGIFVVLAAVAGLVVWLMIK